MSTEHITNCIALLNRYHSAKTKSLCQFGNMLTGEVAIATFDDMMEDLYENGWEDKAEEYIFAFEEELKRRVGSD